MKDEKKHTGMKARMCILDDDLEYQEYCASMDEAKIHQDKKFRNRGVEVTEIVFGDNLLTFRNRVWLFSGTNTLYMCDKCLQRYPDRVSFDRHFVECVQRPPGTCIYVEDMCSIAIFEVDGEQERLFCQRLCTIGKAFIHRKTLYLDVGGYLFYILCVCGRIVGFFSREKESLQHNLSCLLVLPPYQCNGYGSLLIDISYVLRTGSPEKPLSEEGRAIYKKYWRNKVLRVLEGLDGQDVSISDLSEMSGLSIDDVVHALELMGIDPESPVYDCSTLPPPSFRECKLRCLLLPLD